MSTANPTPAELLAQRDEIDRQIAIANLDGLKHIQAALKSGKVATLAADLEALVPQLAQDTAQGAPCQQIGNVITTVRNVSNFFDGEVARVQAIVDAQAAA